MKKIALVLACCLTSTAYAETSAVEFAHQAATIAGIARGCGQDVSVFSPRVIEAIKVLAANNEDAHGAINIFQQMEMEAYAKQTALHAAPCTQVLKDFATLPLLKDDYKTSVLAKLKTEVGGSDKQIAANDNTPSKNNTETNSTQKQLSATDSNQIKK